MKHEGDPRRATLGFTPKRIIATGAVAGAAFFGATSAASASTTHTSVLSNSAAPTPGGIKPLADGKVTAVGTGTFSVRDASGKTFTVNVSSATTYQEPGVTSADIGDVKVGTYVDVVGTAAGSVINATVVRIESGEFRGSYMSGAGAMPAAAGKITSVGTGTFTIQDRSGASITVKVNGTTAYEERGVTSVGFSNVKVGEYAAVMGTKTVVTVTATDVHLATAAPGAQRSGPPGFGPPGSGPPGFGPPGFGPPGFGPPGFGPPGFGPPGFGPPGSGPRGFGSGGPRRRYAAPGTGAAPG